MRLLLATLTAALLAATAAHAEFGTNSDRGYGSASSGPSGRASQDPGWTGSFTEWSDALTGQGARRGRVTAREIGADEIDRSGRLGHGQGGPSGGQRNDRLGQNGGVPGL